GDLSGPSPIPASVAGQTLGVVQGAKPPEPSYKDSLANPATQEKSTCGAWAIVADCSSGQHHFAKKLVCGKEWCPDCGQDNSAANKRRQARILPKLQQVARLGYFVIEFPDVYRHIGHRGEDPDLDGGKYVAGWCYSKADLRATTNTIVNVLAGERCGRRGRVGGYFGRGLGRWHWFGEKCPGKYNPHFNVLVDGGFLEPELLETIKADLRAALNVPDLIVHYSHFDKPGQIVQKARYVTRATFHNYDWNPYMADELYNFRNVRWWGSWSGPVVWELNEAEAEGEDVDGFQAVSCLQEGVCPDCGQPLKVLRYNHKTGKPVQWSRPVDSVYLDLWQAEEISGSGYYRIPHREWTGYNFSPGELLKLEEMEARKRAWVRVAAERAERERAVEAEYQAVLWRGLMN
ncbi:hypothetical protein LCGC14_1751360, partial [marine sediment metagenome]